jgi:protein TonB
MEGNMFRDTLLDSSPAGRKHKRWPMATAFAVEVAVAGLLILLPLLSSGILPVSAHPPIWLPMRDMPIAEPHHPESHPGSGGPRYQATDRVVTFDSNRYDTCYTRCKQPANDVDEPVPPNWEGIGNNGPNRDFSVSTTPKPVLEKPHRVSEIALGQLAHRVEPVYPRMAILTRQEGRVQLHAIIAKDGSIRSLEVMNGLPLLAGAAMDAVKQWRYYPYKLNGEPVEVETLITVNFRATGN